MTNCEAALAESSSIHHSTNGEKQLSIAKHTFEHHHSYHPRVRAEQCRSQEPGVCIHCVSNQHHGARLSRQAVPRQGRWSSLIALPKQAGGRW